MGLFAPPAPFLSGRIGSRGAIGAAVALIGLFGIARAVAPGAIAVIALTIPIGVGMGLGNALLPVAVKERFSDKPGFTTGVYTMGITAGATIAAAIAVPLADAAGGWRTPLLVIGAVSTVLAVVWIWLTRRDSPARAHRRRGR
jgi:Cyanate permease